MSKSALIRGTTYLTLSNIIFLASGYIVQILVGRFFDPVLYGTFGIVIYLLNLIITMLAAGFNQGISRCISEKESAAKTIQKNALKIELALTGIFAILYFILSPLIAKAFGDPSMSYYLRITALLIPIYGIRTVYNGVLNGLKRFDKVALAQISAAVVKLAMVAVFLYLGLGIGSILIAYFFAALASLFVAMVSSKISEGGTEPYSGKKLLKISIPISLYAFAFPFLLSIDLFLVKRLLPDASQAGYYNSATTLARFLYLAFVGLNISLLPVISSLFFKGNLDRVRYYIRNALRFTLMILIPFSLIASLTASSLIPFIFSAKYLPAITPFSILVFGITILTIISLFMTLMIAIGKQNLILIITIILIVVSLGLNSFLIPRCGLSGAAWATTLTSVIGLLIVFPYVSTKIKRVINAKSFLNIIVASTLTGFLTWWLNNNYSFDGIIIIPWYVLIIFVYFVILIFLKEISKNDLEPIKNTFFNKSRKE